MFQPFLNSVNIFRIFLLLSPHLHLILSTFPCLLWREQEKQTNNGYYLLNFNYVEQKHDW